MSSEACPAGPFFPYDESHTDYLKKREPRFAELIDSFGHIYRPIYPDPFLGLVHCILGQQISAKAHASLYQKFLNAYGGSDPAKLETIPVEELRKLGIPQRKAVYIKNVAGEFTSGALNAGELAQMGNYSMSRRLMQIPGIGPWTVEMLQIFTFCRMDVISYNDLGIRKALQKLYGWKSLSFSRFMEYTSKYASVGSVASLYLWAYNERRPDAPGTGV